ncbi:helix-turn-helix domain-containing protein [Mucilaginibacter agri]|nr:helix-turn-helix transcriptional regulator [Mucilaginibacter agri]
MFNRQAVADHIRKCREDKGLTQFYMAYKLQISQNCYSKMELGYSKISLERLFQISEVLEIDAIDTIALGRIKSMVVIKNY